MAAPRPTSEVEIANLALDELGEPPVQDIDSPTTKTAELLRRNFARSRQDVLSKHEWKFAKGRAVVTRNGAGTFDYADSYTLPTDFISFLSIEGFEWWQNDDYDIQETNLLANASTAATLNLRYTRDVEQVGKWTANFVELVVLTLAKNIAYALTGNNNNVIRLSELLKEKWAEVLATDRKSTPPRQVRGTGVTEVVNLAMDYLRLPVIDSITGNSQKEQLLATHYAIERQSELRAHVWKFAKKRANAAINVTAPLFDYTDAYDLPADCLRLLSVNGERIEDQELDYDMEGGKVQLNNSAAATLPIRYVADITDTTLWHSDFKKVLALRIARATGPILGAEREQLLFVQNEIDEFKPSALAVDAQAVRPKMISRSRMLARRTKPGSISRDYRFYDQS